MSKLQELINKLCPNGVEFKPLGEVFEMRNGYTPSKNNPDFWEGGTIPWFRMDDIRENGRILSDSIQHITPSAIKGKGLFEANSFILATTATIGEHALIIADSLANQQFTNLKVRKSLSNLLVTKFIYYYMFIVDDFCKRNTNVSGFASVDMDKLKKMPFPVPPIEVQEEIVRILDSFSDYAAELQAELQARKQQYEYYRNLLLTFNSSAYGCGTDDEQKDGVTTWEGHNYKIQWKKMGEICKSINTGLNPRKFFKLNTPDANGYYVTIREIRNGRIIFSEKTDRINNAALKLCNNRSNIESGDVLFSGTGTIGQVAVVHESPSNWNIKEGVYAIKPITCIISPFFLRYLLESKNIKDSIMKRVAGGTVQSISMAELKNIVIPIPPLELQEKIVAILDRFETLVNDLTNGLPAEIAAVKDQYEYYRNKLLTFKKLSA